MIFDERVWRGGASRERVEELRAGMGRTKSGRRKSGRDHGSSGMREKDVGVDGDGRLNGHATYRSDRRSIVGYTGDRRSHMSEQLGPRRSVLGEVTRGR